MSTSARGGSGSLEGGGRLVRSLHRGRLGRGETLLRWDGRDDAGRRTAAGVYFLRGADGREVRGETLIRLR